MRALKFIVILSYAFLLYSFVNFYPQKEMENKDVKCMVQLINYEGEGAYIVVSIVDQEGKYQETLRVLGDDEEWYPDLASWWSYYAQSKYPIDGITGATIGGGERSIFALTIDEKWLDKGNSLRFETAVEDQDYYIKDVEFALTQENLNTKLEGDGYIRYVRLFAK